MPNGIALGHLLSKMMKVTSMSGVGRVSNILAKIRTKTGDIAE